MKNKITIKSICLFIMFFFFYQHLWCQNPINIIQSNQLDKILINDTVFQKLSGNVIIEYTDFKIQCDTILFNEHKDKLIGWGNIIVSNSKLNCISDSINIRELDKVISFFNNTIIEIDDITIYSNYIKYNYEKNLLQYSKGGHVVNQDYKIESIEFKYNNKSKIADFNNQVKLHHEAYNIFTSKITKNNDVINFLGETIIYKDDITIKCKKGVLEEFKSFNLYTDILVESDNQSIRSNNLVVDLENNTSYFSNNVDVQINENTHLFGDNLNKFDTISTIINNSYLQLINTTDTLIIYGDTLKINNNKEELSIINNVEIDNNQLEGSCQRMEFCSNYKEIYMYTQPVLWFEDTQITGDVIELYTNKNKLDSIYITKKPFIISPIDSLDYFNQISGNTLNGKFKNQKLDYININGNSQVKYFEKNKKKDKININNIQSGKIKIQFNDNKIKELISYDQIESNYSEIDILRTKTTEKTLYLDGFIKINRL
tara:strand:- start:184 stop:1644 length:1461 start_codon:yes stop_codon:yes gene_type:complete